MSSVDPTYPYGELGGMIPEPQRGQVWRSLPGRDGVMRGTGTAVVVVGVLVDLSGYSSLVVYRDNGVYRVENEHSFRSRYEVTDA